MKDIHYSITELIQYALKKDLIKNEDKIWATNQILSRLNLTSFKPCKITSTLPQYPQDILADISFWAVKNKLIKDLPISKELFETDLIGTFAQRPSDFISSFDKVVKEKGIETAAKWMYEKEAELYYIKLEQTKKNISWKTQTKKGLLDLRINLAKPEKNPKEIALLRSLGSKALQDLAYPKCVLCAENEGYSGRLDHPARQNIRLIPLNLNNENWYFQYSPYVYYNEHCIILGQKHTDMLINEKTFKRFTDFLEEFPHYFIGSNADLPIVGGSILNHDHYQGGNYVFPIHKAKIKKSFKLKAYPKVKCFVLDWAPSVVRIKGNRKDVLAASNYIFNKWKNYSDISADIRAYSGKTRHNTVTPMAKMEGKDFQFDFALRNNRTTKEFGDGIFHSRPKYYHIKREGIGLIEVMGIMILPGRLKTELKIIEEYLLAGKIEKIKTNKETIKHYDWIKELASKYKFTSKNITEILQKEVGKIMEIELECCSVFKDDDSFDRFIKYLA